MRLSYVNWELLHNHENHNTQGLSSKYLVVRRGHPFKIMLYFKDTPFNTKTDRLGFMAHLGSLYAEFTATSPKPTTCEKWSAQILSANVYSDVIRVQIWPSAQAPIGLYTLHLQIQSQHHQHSYLTGNFVLLYNPWCRADAVYFPCESHLDEYVKNDFGILFMGTPDNVTPRTWAYGQYEKDILEICLKILEVSSQHLRNTDKDNWRRSDPVYLSRVVCAMINCQDDLGVLQGNWSGDFSKGVNPSKWTGSADILRRWSRSNCSPVMYGQCWVFAAVMCTVMRLLGVPTRVITNFNSAHDTNANLVIEEYYTEKGEKLNQSKDSIWNYHLWVECWMRRPDLAPGFDGWQVLDPTPQEKSRGIYCCGPCPVKAIKAKRLDVPYDIPFIYAEVNADVYTILIKNGRTLNLSVDTDRVGTLICTKAVDSVFPETVTSNYKYFKSGVTNPNGSKDESTRQSLSLSLQLNKVPVAGEIVSLSVAVKNLSNRMRILKVQVNAQAKECNSNLMETFWQGCRTVELSPFGASIIQYRIPHLKYEKMLLADGLVNLAVVVTDDVTQEHVLASKEFHIASPTITIQVENEDDILVNKKSTALVIFHNVFPLSVSGLLTVTGSALIEGQKESKVQLLNPGDRMESTVTFTPTMVGTKMLQASLVLDQNRTVVRGFTTVLVRAP